MVGILLLFQKYITSHFHHGLEYSSNTRGVISLHGNVRNVSSQHLGIHSSFQEIQQLEVFSLTSTIAGVINKQIDAPPLLEINQAINTEGETGLR